ncbi:MAG: hypothetical protein ABI440_06965 [Casimicrobiaceae bacterium]
MLRIVPNRARLFPFLDGADVYIGGMSAMAYDFPGYARPMFFRNQPAGTSTDASGSRLFECGTHVFHQQCAGIHSPIERGCADDHRQMSALRRARLDAYRFTSAVPDATPRGAIHAAVSGPPPAWMTAVAKSSAH